MPLGQVESRGAQHVLERGEATGVPSPRRVGYRSVVTVSLSVIKTASVKIDLIWSPSQYVLFACLGFFLGTKMLPLPPFSCGGHRGNLLEVWNFQKITEGTVQLWLAKVRDLFVVWIVFSPYSIHREDMLVNCQFLKNHSVPCGDKEQKCFLFCFTNPYCSVFKNIETLLCVTRAGNIAFSISAVFPQFWILPTIQA